MDRLWDALCAIEGVEESPSRFRDAPALWVNGKDVAHQDGDDVLDIRLTRDVVRARRAEMLADPRVQLRRSSSADWIQVTVRDTADHEFVLALFRAAVGAHRGRASSRPW